MMAAICFGSLSVRRDTDLCTRAFAIVIAIDLSVRPPDKSAAIPSRPASICAQHTGIYCIGTEQGRFKGLREGC